MAIGMQTYMENDMRESLLSILKDVSPLGGNWLMGNLATSTALQTKHEWPVFAVARPSSVTFKAEGATVSAVDLTSPTKSSNFTAILSRVVQVTGTDRAVSVATNEDPFTFQKRVALKLLNSDMEYAVINNSAAVTGVSGTARQIAGLVGCISNLVTARTSGTSFVTAELENILQASWDAVGAEYVADTLLVPMCIKRRISGFTTNVTNYVNETDKLYRNISTYEASTGVVRVIAHKDVAKAAGTCAVLAIKPELFRVAYLQGREPKWEAMAKTADADLGHYLTEFTLESLGQGASVYTKGWAIEQ